MRCTRVYDSDTADSSWTWFRQCIPCVAKERNLDLTAAAERDTDTLPIDAALTGPAVVRGATVAGSGEAAVAIAVVEADGRRSVVQCAEPAVTESFAGADPVGRRVEVGAPGEFTLL